MQKIVLYITSKAYRQTVDHVIKEMELMTIECNNVIGNLVSLEDFMSKKGFLLGDNDVDYFIIDLSALIDTDEKIVDSISGFLTMHEHVRVIIIAPKNQIGDKILATLFSIGIRNFAAGGDFVITRQMLLKCLSESGMSYKDAIEYKDIKERDRIEVKEIREVNMVMIGLVGTQQRVGCTHNAIIIANQLKKMGFAVAYIEMNHSGALQMIRQNERVNMIDKLFFTCRNIDFYPDCDELLLKKIQNEKVYNFLILDFGDFNECNINCYNKCHVKIAIGNVQPWETQHLVDFWNRYDDEARKQIHIYINFLSGEKDRKTLEKLFKRRFYYIDFQQNPFTVEKFPRLKEILSDYLPSSTEKKRLPLFGFGKKGN